MKDRFKYRFTVSFIFCFIVFLYSTQYAFGFTLGDVLRNLPVSLPIPSFLQPILQTPIEQILENFIKPKPNKDVSTEIPTVLNEIPNQLLENISLQNPLLQNLVNIASPQNLPIPINTPSNIQDIASFLQSAGASNSNNSNLPQSVLSRFLAFMNTSSPLNTITTLTSINPETGLQEIVGATLQGTSFLNLFSQFTPSTNLMISKNRPVNQTSGPICLGGANGTTSIPEGTCGPQYYNSTTSLCCQSGRWIKKLNGGVFSIPVLPGDDDILPKPGGPSPKKLPTVPQPSKANQPVPADSPGTCTCTCSGSYQACLNNWPANSIMCKTEQGSASGSEFVRSRAECNQVECIKKAPGYASQLAAKQNAWLVYINITGCSKIEFIPK